MTSRMLALAVFAMVVDPSASVARADDLKYGVCVGAANYTRVDSQQNVGEASSVILVFTDKRSAKHMALTDEHGAYFVLLEPGEYRVSVYSFEGKNLSLTPTHFRTVTVVAGENRGVYFEILEPK